MKTRLTLFQAYRLARKRMVWFAFVFAVLFSTCGLAQYFFVTQQMLKDTKADLEVLANRIEQELAFTNSWNLNGYRHSEFAASAYYVFTADGFQIENGEFVPGLVARVAMIDDAANERPRTVTTPVGEKWRLFRKNVAGGFVILGILDLDNNLKDLEAADKILYGEAKKFGSTLDEAAKVRTRDTSWEVDYLSLRAASH